MKRNIMSLYEFETSKDLQGMQGNIGTCAKPSRPSGREGRHRAMSSLLLALTPTSIVAMIVIGSAPVAVLGVRPYRSGRALGAFGIVPGASPVAGRARRLAQSVPSSSSSSFATSVFAPPSLEWTGLGPRRPCVVYSPSLATRTVLGGGARLAPAGITKKATATSTTSTTTTTCLEASPVGNDDGSGGGDRGLIGFFGSTTRNFSEAAREGFGTRARNVASTMKVGDVVVPLCADLERRQELANRGIYAGVEYVICSMEEAEEEEKEPNGHNDGVVSGGVRTATIRPAYPLRDHLERPDWPVTVQPTVDVPLWLNRNVYEAGTAVGTLALALTTLLTASVAALFVRFAYVPSESMLPAVAPGDVVLVSRSANVVGPSWLRPKAGDVVFFDPPVELNDAIANSAVTRAAGRVVPSTKGKQFLKRVVAVPGETVGVKDSEPYVLTSLSSSSSSSSSSMALGQDSIKGQGQGQEQDRKVNVRVDIVGPYSRPDVFPPSSWNRAASTLSDHEYFVAGDNGPRSVDSRVWGPLKDKYLFGTARFIMWPPQHFGPIRPGNFVEVSDFPLLK